MVPGGFEAVAHPVFMVLRREIPLPLDDEDEDGRRRRRVAFGEPWEATDEAIAGAGPGAVGGNQQQEEAGAVASSKGGDDTDAAAAAAAGADKQAAASSPDSKRRRKAAGEAAEEDEETELECSICQDDEMKDPVTCCVQRCNHSYCKSCIKRWLAISQRCPLCQQGVTWLLGFASYSSSSAAAEAKGSSSSSGGSSSLRYTLLAVGPDQAELERQPFPAPQLLQEARAKQLKLHKAMEKRHKKRERHGKAAATMVVGVGREDEEQRRREEKERRKRKRKKEEGEKGKGRAKQSAAAVLEDELARINRQIERQSRKLGERDG